MRPVTGVLSLGLANGVALLAAVASAALYARWLAPGEFAHWAMALALARAGLLVLDGGLKTALVRRVDAPDTATLSRLGRLSAALALLMTVVAVLITTQLWASGRLAAGSALLLAAYPAAYLLAYPPLFAALARLERAQRFGPVGRAEGASVALEFALPVALIFAGMPWWAAFVCAAGAARVLRTLWVVTAARQLSAETATPVGVQPRELLKEGTGVQAVAGLSMARDQAHLWLVAPWFGAHWAGVYTLALTACALASQASVATAARISLPALRAADPAVQWTQVLARVQQLAMATLPLVALVPSWLAWIDQAWWGGKWQDAAAVLPWVTARMIPGVATTVLGAWLLVACSPWQAARAHAAWLGAEALLAAVALVVLGPVGLAVAGAFSPWIAIVVFTRAAAPGPILLPRLGAIASALLMRPSLWVAVALAAWAHAVPTALPWITLALPLAWLSEPGLRRWALGRLQAARPAAPVHTTSE